MWTTTGTAAFSRRSCPRWRRAEVRGRRASGEWRGERGERPIECSVPAAAGGRTRPGSDEHGWLRVLTGLALVAGLFTPGAARAASVELGGGGLLPAPSDSRRLNTGWTAELALGSHGRAASETRVVLRQGVMESGGSTLYGFPPASSGSLRLYRDDPDVVRCTALEGVMRHSWGARWRIFVEGRSGLVWLGSHAIHNEPTNDRRPDPGQTLRHARGIGATTSVGTGLAVDLSRQLALIVAGMACSATTDGVADPQFPIRGALEWTRSAAAPAPADAGRHGMRFSLAPGTSSLPRPPAGAGGAAPPPPAGRGAQPP